MTRDITCSQADQEILCFEPIFIKIKTVKMIPHYKTTTRWFWLCIILIMDLIIDWLTFWYFVLSVGCLLYLIQYYNNKIGPPPPPQAGQTAGCTLVLISTRERRAKPDCDCDASQPGVLRLIRLGRLSQAQHWALLLSFIRRLSTRISQSRSWRVGKRTIMKTLLFVRQNTKQISTISTRSV